MRMLKGLVKWLMEERSAKVGDALSEGERCAAVFLAASSGMLPSVPSSTAYSQAGVLRRIAEGERGHGTRLPKQGSGQARGVFNRPSPT